MRRTGLCVRRIRLRVRRIRLCVQWIFSLFLCTFLFSHSILLCLLIYIILLRYYLLIFEFFTFVFLSIIFYFYSIFSIFQIILLNIVFDNSIFSTSYIILYYMSCIYDRYFLLFHSANLVFTHLFSFIEDVIFIDFHVCQ